MNLFFSKEYHEDIVVEKVELSRATLKEAKEFKNILTEDIEKGYLKFAVDLNDCEFMDSTFLSTLVTTLKTLVKKGGNLKLFSVNHDTQNLMELTGTDKIFEIFKTKKEAINSFDLKVVS